MGRVLFPPEIIEIYGPLFFLGGPIQGAPDWQARAIRLIQILDPLVNIACPRKKYRRGTFVYEAQVDWETHYLRRAGEKGVIIFWLAKQAKRTPGRSYAQTTRFEFGEWTARQQFRRAKIIIGIEEGFTNARYIRRRLAQDCPDVQICSSLAETCSKAIELLIAKNFRG